MLSEFITANRAEIIARCRARVAARTAPRPTVDELEQGVPLFLEHLTATLSAKLNDRVADVDGASKHGADLLHGGFTVAQVVHDYGNVCQTITELAIEHGAPITTAEFKVLNLCLDDSIADAVTEYARQRDLELAAEGTERAVEDLGIFAHELRNLLATATLAFDALHSGSVGISGSTGAVLGRSLMSLRDLVDRSLAAVRLKAGMATPERLVIGELIEEVEIAAMMQAKARGLALTVETPDRDAVVEADRQILASVIANLVQNALKYTRPDSHVTLRTSATAERVRVEVEDECGGLPPGKAETLFLPFQRRSADRSGLGLGLTISSRGIHAIGGTIGVRDLPGKGCIFLVELPRVPA